MKAIELVLRGEYITLDALLKSTGLAPSGGAAKALVAEGRVQVDGQDELRKTCKLRAGQVVRLGNARVRIVAPADPAEGLTAARPSAAKATAEHPPTPASTRAGPAAGDPATSDSMGGDLSRAPPPTAD